MPFRATQELVHERGKAQVGRVRVGDGQEVLGVEDRCVAQRRRGEAGQEVPVELDVVADEGPPGEGGGDGAGQLGRGGGADPT